MDFNTGQPIQIIKKKRSIGKRLVIWIPIILVLALLVGSVGISAYVGWSLTHPARKALDESPAEYELTYEKIIFQSRDGEVNLQGWFLPGAENADMTLIFAHGYRGNRLEQNLPALALAKSLVSEGYNVVMFDFRNSGESEGKKTSVGQFEKQDLLGAIDWVKSNHPSKIGLIGFSMGAATSIIAAAEEPDVVGLVADSPFNNLNEYLSSNLSHWSNLPEYPFTPLIMAIIPPLTGMNPSEVDPLTAVDKIYPRPILFIHGDADDAIPMSNSEEMVSKYPDLFSLWTVSGAGHVKSYSIDPEGYTQKVLEFFGSIR